MGRRKPHHFIFKDGSERDLVILYTLENLYIVHSDSRSIYLVSKEYVEEVQPPKLR